MHGPHQQCCIPKGVRTPAGVREGDGEGEGVRLTGVGVTLGVAVIVASQNWFNTIWSDG
jgi:hypothetical protein